MVLSQIRKRDGKIVLFNKQKIVNAIYKTIVATGGNDRNLAEKIADKVVEIVESKYSDNNVPNVEHVQDVVERILIEEGHTTIAKGYILYREKRREFREAKNTLLNIENTMDEYLQKSDWRVNENANVDFSLGGLILYISGKITANYWLNNIYNKEIRNAHINGDFHLHDLSMFSGYSFYRNETIVVRQKSINKIYCLALEQLYNLVEASIIEENDFEIKYTNDFEVLDENGWTDIKRVLRHKTDKKLLSFNTKNGHNLIVTEDHPFIVLEEKKESINCSKCGSLNVIKNRTNKGSIDYFKCKECNNNFSFKLNKTPNIKLRNTKIARNISINDYVLTPNISLNLLKSKNLNSTDGWFLGFFIAEGYFKQGYIAFELNKESLEARKLLKYLNLNNMHYILLNREKIIDLGNSLQNVVREDIVSITIPIDCLSNDLQASFSQIRAYSENKNLPIDFLSYEDDVIGGIVSGIIDGDGIIRNDDKWVSRATIRITSKTALSQIQTWLNLNNINSSLSTIDSFGERMFNGIKIESKKQLYCLSIYIPETVKGFFNECIKIDENFLYSKKDSNKKLFSEFRKIEEIDNDNEFVYDITTDSHTFLCNGLLSHNCAGWSLRQLILEGFGGVPNRLQTVPARHFDTLIGQMVNFLGTLQNEWAGAQALSSFDTYLSAFVRHDNMNYKQVKQQIQRFMFNMATPSRWGSQSPFTNTTLDWIVPDDLANQPAIVCGKPQSYTYGDCQKEMDMVNKAFIECMIEGDASKRVFTFPIPTYNITRDFNWDSENSTLLFDMTAKYGIPYFQNFINSSLKPSDVRSMCLHPDEEIIVKINKNIKRIKIGELIEKYSEEFDEDGWSKNNYNIEAISINPETFNAEWVKIKNFLRKKHNKLIIISNKGGKKIKVSPNHLIPVIENGKINYKFSQEIKVGDIMLVSRNSSSLLNKEKIIVNNYLLDEDLAKIFGFFLAEGNYLKDSRKRWYGRIRGLQFTFHKDEENYINELFELIKKKFNYEAKIRDDPRYPTKYLYIYNTKLAKDFYDLMNGRFIPEEIFNSPKSVIKTFLDYFFKGDGYKNGNEIHINDLSLSRDLVLLYNLIDIPTTYVEKENSQLIRLQHTNGRGSRNIRFNDILYNLIPIELVNIEEIHGVRRSCVRKNKFVGKNLLEKYGGYEKLKNYFEKGIAFSPVISVVHKDLDCEQMFYDIELEKNHIFVHSLGTVTHNCCRLQLDLRELRNKGGGGLFGAGENTGSVGVVTINMPRIGYLAGTENEFLERLGYLMEIAKQSLEVKRKVISQKMEQGLLPYTKRYLGNLNHHFSTIGLIGMNEACLNLFGENIATKRGREFSLMTLEFMREKLTKFQEETKNIYNLEATPGEGTSYRLAKIDKHKFPDIITAGKNEPYYTNSSILPVNYTDDVFEALELQDELQTKYTGGCIEKGNKVLTNKGLFNIEYIVKNFKKLSPIKTLSYNPRKGVGEWDEIVDAVSIDVKEREKIRIKSERNLDITTSDWHPFFVLEKIKINPSCPICEKKVKNKKAFAAHLRFNKKCRKKYKNIPKYNVVEKRADNLKINDYILQNSDNLYPKRYTKLNKDLMWLIGFFIGDGNISKFIDNRGGNNLERHKIRFFSEHKQTLEKVRKILSKYFKVKANIIKNDKRSEKLRELSTPKKEVLEFFFKYGFKAGKKVYDISIPQKVKINLTKYNIFSLLSGLADSDGHIDKRDGNFEYYTVSSQLAEDILEICSSAGIMVSKKEKLSKRQNEVNIYILRIPQYQMTKIKNKLNITVNLSRIKGSLSNRKKRYFPVVRVKEISKIDVKDNQFYDLTTKNNHNYLAGKNSLVFIHNTVMHCFIGERLSDAETTKKLVRKIAYNFRLPYYTITPTFSICQQHGYIKGEVHKCPQCNTPTEVYSRVVGYLRPVQQWNKGKKEEFFERKTYSYEKSIKHEVSEEALSKIKIQRTLN